MGFCIQDLEVECGLSVARSALLYHVYKWYLWICVLVCGCLGGCLFLSVVDPSLDIVPLWTSHKAMETSGLWCLT